MKTQEVDIYVGNQGRLSVRDAATGDFVDIGQWDGENGRLKVRLTVIVPLAFEVVR